MNDREKRPREKLEQAKKNDIKMKGDWSWIIYNKARKGRTVHVFLYMTHFCPY